MARNTKGLEKYYKIKTENAINKVKATLEELQKNGEKINFNVVANKSGVSKTFLYANKEIKEKIEILRNNQVNNEINQRSKRDKTSKAKDIIIEVKNRRINQLENENKKLKEEINNLRCMLYNKI